MDGDKKVNRRKGHILVAGTSDLLEVKVTTANIPDAQGSRVVMDKTKPYTRHCLQRI